ncbi:hypothetical protein BT69DRAFT_1336073 [Atractiella rhizophila]|nr:hypothetical protein BT69DRAFT_1336073 [Atractiella rhizophila]
MYDLRTHRHTPQPHRLPPSISEEARNCGVLDRTFLVLSGKSERAEYLSSIVWRGRYKITIEPSSSSPLAASLTSSSSSSPSSSPSPFSKSRGYERPLSRTTMRTRAPSTSWSVRSGCSNLSQSSGYADYETSSQGTSSPSVSPFSSPRSSSPPPLKPLKRTPLQQKLETYALLNNYLPLEEDVDWAWRAYDFREREEGERDVQPVRRKSKRERERKGVHRKRPRAVDKPPQVVGETPPD